MPIPPGRSAAARLRDAHVARGHADSLPQQRFARRSRGARGTSTSTPRLCAPTSPTGPRADAGGQRAVDQQVVPVMYAACCEHRNAAAAPMSAGSPRRPAGICRERPPSAASRGAGHVDDAVGRDAAGVQRVERDAVAGGLAGEHLEADDQAGSVGVGELERADRLAHRARGTVTTRPQPRSRICGSSRLEDRHRREHERAVRRLPLLAREARAGPRWAAGRRCWRCRCRSGRARTRRRRAGRGWRRGRRSRTRSPCRRSAPRPPRPTPCCARRPPRGRPRPPARSRSRGRSPSSRR